ncbi:MAG: thioredoxin-disulfide reductase [Endomicrobium sp.]|jgi:thioredoxin reductase (NADPH)|nr:thioredoxin-disulfide reductase [Endomicrobium sp.]
MVYDVIIVGGGPAGLSASIYSSRARLKTLLIEKNGCGGQMIVTDLLENYPGFNKGINGFDLAVKLESQARDFGTEIVYDEVIEIKNGNIKKVLTLNSVYDAKTVIIAAGTRVKEMNIPGEAKFKGNGVSFCATCDAPFYKDKEVLVVGGGDSAIQEAIYLAKFTKKVTILHRRSGLRATKILQERMLSYSNISIMYNTIPKEIIGEEQIKEVIITDLKTNQDEHLRVDGVFVFIGLVPNTSFSIGVDIDENGYILTDENMHTSIDGIFACGDIREKHLRQVVTAASDGAQAAVAAVYYIDTL